MCMYPETKVPRRRPRRSGHMGGGGAAFRSTRYFLAIAVDAVLLFGFARGPRRGGQVLMWIVAPQVALLLGNLASEIHSGVHHFELCTSGQSRRLCLGEREEEAADADALGVEEGGMTGTGNRPKSSASLQLIIGDQLTGQPHFG